MLQMTRDININGQKHVQQTGVTCYTCHRGNPIPQYTWFVNEGRVRRGATAGTAGQNVPAQVVGLTSLPYDPFRPTCSTSSRRGSSARRRCRPATPPTSRRPSPSTA